MSEIQKGAGTNRSWEFWFNDDFNVAISSTITP
jgi:hypothetical protein